MQQRITVKNVAAQAIGFGNAKAQKIGVGNAQKIIVGADPYEGAYVFTPTSERQVLETAHKALSENLIIEAIPNNYGLITYNGFLTIT